MEKKNYFDRFKKITKADWIIIIFMTLVAGFALYMSIGFSVSIANGLTLFGDSDAYTNTTTEVGPATSADITVLVLYWVLTLVVLALDVYFIFFKKPNDTKPVRKEIVDGHTIIVKEEKDEVDDAKK